MVEKFCIDCGTKFIKRSKYCLNCGEKRSKKSKRILWVVIIIIGIVFFGWFFSGSEEEKFIEDSIFEPIMKTFREDGSGELGSDITSSVVNVLCPFSGEPMNLSSNGTGGSGVVINEEGVILTNSHVIPQDEEILNINEEGCIVVFPDDKTGLPREAYLAQPYVMGEYSDEYDLAWLEIYDVYTGNDGETYGNFPRIFPSAWELDCEGENIKLGEKVKIYGYPQATGGYSLTITEGVVSAFNEDGLITSAKIDMGNSGGLATDEKGCFMGIPTAVRFGEAESYGVIITSDLVGEFFEKVNSLIDGE
jgi:S1-C subfamily serine protease